MVLSRGSPNNTEGFLSYPRTELAAPTVLCFSPFYYQRFLISGHELVVALSEGERASGNLEQQEEHGLCHSENSVLEGC